LPCGGGEGAAHSIVVACHGFSPVFSPFQMLQKKLKMKGIWKIARIHAPQAYRGPYEYSVPGAAKDFIAQNEA
jgi:hypothetical protein